MFLPTELMGRPNKNRPSINTRHFFIISFIIFYELLLTTIYPNLFQLYLNEFHSENDKFIYHLQKQIINYLQMKCCQDSSNEHQLMARDKLNKIQEDEPVKFKILSFLGLREYLINKYVFVRSNPRYQIINKDGHLSLQTKVQISIPPQYHQEIKVIENGNQTVYAISLNLKDRKKYNGTVIYSHGNSSDLSHSLNFMSNFAASFPKFDYIVYQYTGYGKTKDKSITQQSICQDLDILVDSIIPDPSEIILWGFSLGAYPTVRVAAKRKFKGVILQSPLASVYSLFSDKLTVHSTFANDCFSILEHISQIDSFLVFFHSKDDQIIPYDHSKTLYQKYRMSGKNSYCFLVEITSLKHNHMHAFLGDKQQNKIKETMHSYLNLMVDGKNLSKGRQLQIQKEKYIENINKYTQARRINTDCNAIEEERGEESKMVRDSVNFMEIKEQVVFQMDDITHEAEVITGNSFQIQFKKHKGYFRVSQEAKDETEVSCINEEERIHQLQE